MGKSGFLQISGTIAAALLTLSSSAGAAGFDFSLLSLNLHGYHPMNEPARLLEGRDGKVQAAQSYLFHYRLDELDRGHRLQLDSISAQLAPRDYDVILLQEVAAGKPDGALNCADFHRSEAGDPFGKNSALRLVERLNRAGGSYTPYLACRGNAGWVTSPDLFRQQRVVREKDGRREGVFDFGSAPYPRGILVEGTAILVRKSLTVLDHQTWNLPIPGTSESFFAQAVALTSDRSGGWFLVVNLHAGHKLRHFEQAVAVRAKIAEYVAAARFAQKRYAGLIVGGDMNAELFRPNGGSANDPSTLAWELNSQAGFDQGRLVDQLLSMNRSQNYKAWASIRDEAEAERRARSAVTRLSRLPVSAETLLAETVYEAVRGGRCSSCDLRDRIDLVYASVAQQATMFGRYDWYSTANTLSDHPGVSVEFRADF